MVEIEHKKDCKCREDPEAWWIDSPEHHNCFWVYMKYNDRAHTLQEIATLLNLSISAITNIEKKALRKLKKRSEIKNFLK